jgi:hypothetical protein
MQMMLVSCLQRCQVSSVAVLPPQTGSSLRCWDRLLTLFLVHLDGGRESLIATFLPEPPSAFRDPDLTSRWCLEILQ